MLLIRTQTRLLILTATIVFFFLAGMLVLQNHDRRRAAAFLEELKLDKTTLLRELIALRGEPLKTFAYDYTFWDDMVDFVRRGDSTWGDENLASGLTTFHADVLLVLDTNGRKVYMVTSDQAAVADRAYLSEAVAFKLARLQNFGHYFTLVDRRLVELQTAPIQPTLDFARSTPPLGHFVVARIWNDDYLASIGQIAQASVVLDLDPVTLKIPYPREELSQNTTEISVPIAGLGGVPLARLRATIDIPFAEELSENYRNTQIYLFAFGGAILLLLSLLLYQWVSRPLALINRSLQKRDVRPIEDLKRSSTEFGQIARLINTSFTQQAALESEVQERRRTELALSESDYRYRIASEQTGQMVYDWNVLNGAIYWAGAIEQITGYTDAEYQQINIEAWEASIHPEDRAHAREMLDLAAVKDGHYNVEYRLRRKDGGYVYCEDNGVFLIDPTGAVVRMLGTMKDISDRRRAQQKVEDSEKRFRLLFERSTDASLLLTDRIIDCNERACRLWGASREQIIASSPIDFSPKYQPDGRNSAEAASELIRRAMSGEHQLFYWQHVSATGALIECEVSLQVIEMNDGSIIHATMRDIGERKRGEEAIRQSEARLRTLVESLPHRIALKDRDLQYVIVNESFAQGFGLTASQLVGKSDFDLFDRTPAEFERMEDSNILAVNEPAESEHESIEQGETRVRHTVKMPVRDTDGTITGLLVVISDFSERRRLEQALFQSQKMEAVGRLAGGVAHDFNNLLTVITSYAQLIMDDLGPEQDIYSSVEEIRKAAERATNLTRQLLAFSRKSISEPRLLDLNAVISDMEKMFRRIIGEDIEMTLRLDQSLWRIFADAGHVEQVLTNLVVNARDAMPQGGRLTISTCNHQSDGGEHDSSGSPIRAERYTVLDVADSGMGMSPEVKARIFEPFFTTKETGKGTGLGLATVFGIVNQSTGYIQVHSKLGQGTNFRIFLPRATDQSGLTRLKAHESSRRNQIAGRSILLVEDEDSVRTVAGKMLEQHGFTVVAVSGGEEALCVVSKPGATFDLLLTDVVMPVMNGRVVANEVKRILPEVKIAYMSGYTDETIVHHGVLEDGINFIRKPFAREDLIDKVLQALGS